MIFTETSTQAAVYLRQAVPKMIKHNIVPNPFNFTLWYSYYSQQFPGLIKELDHVQEVFQQAMTGLVDSLTQSVEKTAQQSHGFSAALTSNIEKLADCTVQDDMRLVLRELNQNAIALCGVTDSF